jgi:hypothetical protein
VASPPFLAKYLRLRREWLCGDPASGRHQRLSHELAQLERDFAEMGVSPFVDTQPCNDGASQTAATDGE